MVDFSSNDERTLCSQTSEAAFKVVPDCVVCYKVSNPTDITHVTHDSPPIEFPQVSEWVVCSLSHKTSVWARQDPSPGLALRHPPEVSPSPPVQEFIFHFICSCKCARCEFFLYLNRFIGKGEGLVGWWWTEEVGWPGAGWPAAGVLAGFLQPFGTLVVALWSIAASAPPSPQNSTFVFPQTAGRCLLPYPQNSPIARWRHPSKNLLDSLYSLTTDKKYWSWLRACTVFCNMAACYL